MVTWTLCQTSGGATSPVMGFGERLLQHKASKASAVWSTALKSEARGNSPHACASKASAKLCKPERITRDANHLRMMAIVDSEELYTSRDSMNQPMVKGVQHFPHQICTDWPQSQMGVKSQDESIADARRCEGQARSLHQLPVAKGAQLFGGSRSVHPLNTSPYQLNY